MRNKLAILILAAFLQTGTGYSQSPQDLSNWSICIDPGHEGLANMGVFNFPEAYKVVRVGIALRDYLENFSPDTVLMTRDNDQVSVSLSQRTALANSAGVSWFHSIHSDASFNPEANSILLMYGQDMTLRPAVVARFPGEADVMSDIMHVKMADGYRIPSRGSWAEWTYYMQGSWDRTLWVLQQTAMPAELSEGGFHTNPTQNLLNMNQEFRHIEAKSEMASILDYFSMPYPAFMSTVAGIISNEDNGAPLNGAVITIAPAADPGSYQTYTTDTWESLFSQWEVPDASYGNGFYFFEGLPLGQEYRIDVNKYSFYDTTVYFTPVDTLFNFSDIPMISWVPPVVESTYPVAGDTSAPVNKNIVFRFSRKMDTLSVEQEFSVEPELAGTLLWTNENRTLNFIPSQQLPLNTNYTFTIGAAASDLHNHLIDGNADSTGGDAFSLSFKTSAGDYFAPVLLQHFPTADSTVYDQQPIITVVYDELLDPSTVTASRIFLYNAFQDFYPVNIEYHPVGELGVISFYPQDFLPPNDDYYVDINGGLKDLAGNTITNVYNFHFRTPVTFSPFYTMYDFESGAYWQLSPESGGIDTLNTVAMLSDTLLLPVDGYSHNGAFGYHFNPQATPEASIAQFDFSGQFGGVWDDGVLQYYLFGDGSRNRIRLNLIDATGYFVPTDWITLDWGGWRLITTDMRQFIGSFVFPMDFGNFQIGRTAEGSISGAVYMDNLRTNTVSVGIRTDETLVPDKFALAANYPNPFNGGTEISFALPASRAVHSVTLEIFDIRGRKIRSLADSAPFTPGQYQLSWDGRDRHNRAAASGIYFYRLRTEDFSKTRQMLLLK
jgi:N-acetylmuramoyl-L-alanine amidase